MNTIRAIQIGPRTVRLEQPYPKDVLAKLTSFTVPGYFFMNIKKKWERRFVKGRWLKVQVPVWDGRVRYLRDSTLPLGLWRAIVPKLLASGYRVEFKASNKAGTASDILPYLTSLKSSLNAQNCQFPLFDPESCPESLAKLPILKELREYQWDALVAMVKASDCGGLMLLATAAGKTLLTGAFFDVVRPAPCLFVVDELTLLDQAEETLKGHISRPVGTVGEGIFNPQEVTVATIQTLYRHKGNPKFQRWFESLRFVVIDEIHVQMGRTHFDIIEKLQPQATYGLTGTLNLRKGEVRIKAEALTGPVLYEYSTERGIREQYLTQAVVVCVPFVTKGESPSYSEDYDRIILRNKPRNDLAETLTRTAIRSGYKTILLADRVEHLAILEQRLDNLDPQVVWGGRVKKERVAVKKAFEAGLTNLIIANRVFKKGIDLPSADCAVNMSPGASQEEARQSLGRLLRRAEGKRWAIYFDILDKGNRFEDNGKGRRSAFRKAGIPILELTPEECATINEEWFANLEKRIETILKGGLD